MDVVGRFHLADGTEVKVVTGVDDHSRFCVCARVVARATARPVCEALQWALRTHGVPDQILTDNGKVFTARFGQGPGPVLFDRICANNGIRHISHRPVLADDDGQGGALPQDHARRTSWSTTTGCTPSIEALQKRPRRMGRRVQHEAAAPVARRSPAARALRPGAGAAAGRSRDARGRPTRSPLSGPAARCQPLGRPARARSDSEACAIGSEPTFAGERVEVVVRAGLVEILHAGVLVATHAERRRADNEVVAPARATGWALPSADDAA